MELDVSGLSCPMPIIKLKKFLAENPEKDLVVTLVLSDRGGLKDVPAFCRQQSLGCELLADNDELRFKIWRQD
ncbi:sulfurtransferase TusA family protein [Thiomicrorhabdus sp. HH1]|uniref:Sulfurtransferase TusA family protein n=2 Tax=Piscirickettsiaceae TaxID=135616 RepID=A0ABS0C0F0_9GAMM|nr:sulfurtransferase TusA family protein [Thiomicrorhabdus heinhorstiae]